MLLYHGSKSGIEGPIRPMSRERCDFGRGFYLTSMSEQARRMALRVARFRGGRATITEFDAPDDLLEKPDLSVRRFDSVSIDWALFVINNRNRDFADFSSSECNHDLKYDIVFGPVGNDDITFLLEQFTNVYLAKSQLKDGLEFKRASDQYSFHTEHAVSYLEKGGAAYA